METDRQTTGDWQFEEIWCLGRQISSNCQSSMLCLRPRRSFRRWNHQHLHEYQDQKPSRNKRSRPGGGAPPAGVVFVSRGLLMLVFMQMLMIPTPKGSTSRSSTRIQRVFEASNPLWVHQKIENLKTLRIEFWTCDSDVKKVIKITLEPS